MGRSERREKGGRAEEWKKVRGGRGEGGGGVQREEGWICGGEGPFLRARWRFHGGGVESWDPEML